MRSIIAPIVASAAVTAPVQAQSNLEADFAGALRGCQEWVLNPASWVGGVEPFVKTVGLGDRMGLVESVEEVNLPPKQFRKANRYWRINSTQSAGYILVVSDRLPMCHITGGGDADLQPIVEAVLSSPAFKSEWEQLESRSAGDMASTAFRNRQEPKFSIVISRATKAGQRRDRVQIIATAAYEMSN